MATKSPGSHNGGALQRFASLQLGSAGAVPAPVCVASDSACDSHSIHIRRLIWHLIRRHALCTVYARYTEFLSAYEHVSQHHNDEWSTLLRRTEFPPKKFSPSVEFTEQRRQQLEVFMRTVLCGCEPPPLTPRDRLSRSPSCCKRTASESTKRLSLVRLIQTPRRQRYTHWVFKSRGRVLEYTPATPMAKNAIIANHDA